MLLKFSSPPDIVSISSSLGKHINDQDPRQGQSNTDHFTQHSKEKDQRGFHAWFLFSNEVNGLRNVAESILQKDQSINPIAQRLRINLLNCHLPQIKPT
jgi:hypothetical protein